jgi:indole-3-acetate monooxygenase
MRDSEALQFEVGRVAADLRAARAFHQVQVASHWRRALAGTPKDEAFLTQNTQNGIRVAPPVFASPMLASR